MGVKLPLRLTAPSVPADTGADLRLLNQLGCLVLALILPERF